MLMVNNHDTMINGGNKKNVSATSEPTMMNNCDQHVIKKK